MQTPVLQVSDDGGALYKVSHMVRHEHQAAEILGGPVHRIALRNMTPYDSFEAGQAAQFELHKEFMSKTVPEGAACFLPRLRGGYSGENEGKYFVCYDGYVLRKAGYPVAANEIEAQNSPRAFLDEDSAKETQYCKVIAKRTRKVLGKSYKYKGILETRYADYLKLPQYQIRKRGELFQFVLTYYKLTKIEAAQPPHQLDFLLPISETVKIEILQKPSFDGPESLVLDDVEEGSGRRMGA